MPRFPLLLSTVCVLCHSIVGLGLCLWGGVMSLWNSGDGCVGQKDVWCVVCGMRASIPPPLPLPPSLCRWCSG